ncbi:MAG: transcriptional repressor LexA [Gammaproteobacteria bacterium]|nr:transcriptional repressor LexA [Gammaproteobacteria bacterium]HXK56320.1 transcriptional repressor LexA [Gammaproteobacteria bacterium]
MNRSLTRRQHEIYDFLSRHNDDFEHPPTLDELCSALGLSSKGSLHKQIQALVDAGLVEPMNNQRRGVRLVRDEESSALPLLGYIAAGQPIEAVEQRETIRVPELLRTDRPCYVLQVRGDSMIEDGILDGDHIIVEQRDQARNGDIVVALIDGTEATLKRIEQKPGEVVLHPANSRMSPMHFSPDRVTVQGILVGQMRSYH